VQLDTLAAPEFIASCDLVSHHNGTDHSVYVDVIGRVATLPRMVTELRARFNLGHCREVTEPNGLAAACAGYGGYA